MIPETPAALPPETARQLRRAVRLEWWSLAWMLSIVAVMYLAMGNSQAMKTAWIEDVLSLVAPVAILLALRLRHRAPTERFPYGYHAAVSIAFLCAAVALAGVGLFLVWDSASVLLRREHPSIGTVELFGHTVWQGWVMVAALAYSAVPPVLLGRRKLELAPALHLKPLYTDARTNRADWMTACAGIAGVLGIGLGWWWADAAAALFIAIDVLRDGLRNLGNAFGDLMGRGPETVGRGEPDPLGAALCERVEAVAGVRRVQTRLREEGEMLVGEVFFEPASGCDAAALAVAVREAALGTGWRVHDIVAMPVPDLAALLGEGSGEGGGGARRDAGGGRPSGQ